MTEPRVFDVHVHAVRAPGQRLRPRPFCLIRRHYGVLVGFSDGSRRQKPVSFPERDWWVIAALSLMPPWRKPQTCSVQAAQDPYDVEAGLARLMEWLEARTAGRRD